MSNKKGKYFHDEAPEVIAFQIEEGNAEYLRWIGEETGQHNR
jgi:uncharacterized protein involved in tolerance to divalent cations